MRLITIIIKSPLNRESIKILSVVQLRTLFVEFYTNKFKMVLKHGLCFKTVCFKTVLEL